jgi:hypothetical protein
MTGSATGSGWTSGGAVVVSPVTAAPVAGAAGTATFGAAAFAAGLGVALGDGAGAACSRGGAPKATLGATSAAAASPVITLDRKPYLLPLVIPVSLPSAAELQSAANAMLL